MKNRTPPTGREIKLEEDHFIVSKTDTSGRITYADRVFMRISGYSEKELLGKQHNILRHPDMPRSAFKALWDTVQTGQEFFAYVLNLAKNGDHYWVWANVTPDFDQNGKICGYFSVRRKPDDSAVTKVKPVYREMLQAEKEAGTRHAMEAGMEVLLGYVTAQHSSYAQFILSLADKQKITS